MALHKTTYHETIPICKSVVKFFPGRISGPPLSPIMCFHRPRSSQRNTDHANDEMHKRINGQGTNRTGESTIRDTPKALNFWNQPSFGRLHLP
jgi:hypothetical protein